MTNNESSLPGLLGNETATLLQKDPEPWLSADGKRTANALARSTFFPRWEYEQDASKY